MQGSALACVHVRACSSKGDLDQNLISDHYTSIHLERDQCVTSSGRKPRFDLATAEWFALST